MRVKSARLLSIKLAIRKHAAHGWEREHRDVDTD
jgi:hypothetical protein